jgi:transposase
MGAPVRISLSKQERRELERMVRAPSTQVRHRRRAQIVLATAETKARNAVVAVELGVNVNTVRLWRNRFARLGLAGLRDQPGRGRKPVFVGEREARIVAATLEPPEQATHWSSRRLARQVGASKSTVQRVWKAYDLQPHREATFKYSRDPLLVEKTVDVIGLYLYPPEQGLVLCVDEKSQIQALERTQPLLPLRPGLPASRTHDYARHGTVTLFAALERASGQVLHRVTRRHRHQEFLSFLRDIDRAYPAGEIHLVLDNYGTHKHKKVDRWLARRPRYWLHFTPTGASWMNQVEGWFSILTRQAVRRASVNGVQKLIRLLHDFVRHWDEHPTPFRWSKSAETVLKPYSLGISGTGH